MSQAIETSVGVGEKDLMSQLARSAKLPLCGEETAFGSTFLTCTRAAGHDEAKPGHSTRLHVAAVRSGIAMAVWL